MRRGEGARAGQQPRLQREGDAPAFLGAADIGHQLREVGIDPGLRDAPAHALPHRGVVQVERRLGARDHHRPRALARQQLVQRGHGAEDRRAVARHDRRAEVAPVHQHAEGVERPAIGRADLDQPRHHVGALPRSSGGSDPSAGRSAPPYIMA